MTSAVTQVVQSARITPAPGWRVALACLLDLLLMSAGIGATIMLFQTGHPTAGIVTGWVTLALIVWQCTALFRTGQPFGWRLFGVRLTSLGGYPGVGLIKTRGSQYRVADVVRGADPLLPISLVIPANDTVRDEPSPRRSRVTVDAPQTGELPADLPATGTLRRTRAAVPLRARGDELDSLDEHTRVQVKSEARMWRPPAGVDIEPPAEATIFAAQATPQWRVMLDGSDIGLITEPIVFGRNPAPADGSRAVTVMDLSREVSKEHVRLSIEAGLVHVTDLGSTNGSTLVVNGIEHHLTPGEATRVEARATVKFSGHTLTISGKGARQP